MTAMSATVAAALSLASCAPAVVSQPAVTYSQQPFSDRTTVPTPPEDPMPAVVWPLTGEDATDASEADLRRIAIAVKIANTPKARPPKNLELADIVFETYVDYGVSRLIGIWQSNHPEEVGPVRSLRPMDTDIVGSFEGPLVFSGASPGPLRDAVNSPQFVLAQDLRDDGFFRVNYRRAPNNLHVYFDDIVAQSPGLAAPTRQFDFAYPAESATASVQGTAASTFHIRFSRNAEPEWRWSDSTGRWMRYERSDAHVTRDGVHLGADNIVVLLVDVKYVYSTLPKSLVIVQNNPGYVASDGKYIDITWSKDSRTGKFVLRTLDGEPVLLKPGQTWIEVVPKSGNWDNTWWEWS